MKKALRFLTMSLGLLSLVFVAVNKIDEKRNPRVEEILSTSFEGANTPGTEKLLGLQFQSDQWIEEGAKRKKEIMEKGFGNVEKPTWKLQDFNQCPDGCSDETLAKNRKAALTYLQENKKAIERYFSYVGEENSKLTVFEDLSLSVSPAVNLMVFQKSAHLYLRVNPDKWSNDKIIQTLENEAQFYSRSLEQPLLIIQGTVLISSLRRNLELLKTLLSKQAKANAVRLKKYSQVYYFDAEKLIPRLVTGEIKIMAPMMKPEFVGFFGPSMLDRLIWFLWMKPNATLNDMQERYDAMVADKCAFFLTAERRCDQYSRLNYPLYSYFNNGMGKMVLNVTTSNVLRQFQRIVKMQEGLKEELASL